MNNVIELKFTPINKDSYDVEFKGGIEGKDPDLLFGLKNVPSFDRSKYSNYQKAHAKLYKYELRRGVDEPEIEIDRDTELCCQTLTDDLRIKLKEVNVENKRDNEQNQQVFEKSAQTLLETLNDWGKLPEFARIRKAIDDRQENLRVTISSECPDLRKQPFHQWNLFPEGVEVVFSSIEAARLPRFYREKIRILIILGDSRGIDIEKDRKAIERYCKNDAELEILAQPTRSALKTALADPNGWDIIFFSGHSHTENTNTGRIDINATDSLTMAELQDVLKPAIEQRVQIAIFNSCDGLGLAPVLEELNIDRIIVMREPIPDKIAQEFLKSFLAAFTQGKRFDDAVKFARQELVSHEANYPYVSWLPIIVQNRLAPAITWQSLGKVKSPYKGLLAFTEADADNFYGREDTIDRLYQLAWSQPLIAIIGASGSGKSSVVQAGLIPHLKKNFDWDWQIITMRPGRKPFDALASAILNCEHRGLAGSDLQRIELEIDLASDRTLLTQKLAQIRRTGNRVLLFIDQFEEVFTQSEDEETRQVFLQSLADAVNNAPNFTVVLTLRNDFLPTIQSDRQDSDFRQLLERYSPQLLGSMTRDRLTAAITKPAAKLGVQFESGLVDRLLGDVGTTNGSLAILQWVLDLLWAKQQPRLLTYEQYKEICGKDGIDTALANRAEEIYARFVVNNRVKQFKQVFCRLVTPGAGTTATTRRMATRAEIGEDNWREVVVPLATERLLTTDRDAETGIETVEIIHEKIIDNWQRLQNWVKDYREELERIAELEAGAKRWEKSNKSKQELWQNKKLKDARKFVNSPDRVVEFLPIANNFLAASSKHQLWNRGKLWVLGMIIPGIALGFAGRESLIVFHLKTIENADRKQSSNELLGAIEGLRVMRYKLSNLNLSNRNLEGVNFKNANLEGVNLQGANLKDANLEGVNLTYADLRNTRFRRANLKGANLTNANYKSADFKDADLEGANLERSVVYQKHRRVHPKGLQQNSHDDPEPNEESPKVVNDFNNRKAYFYGAKLKNANLKNADLTVAYFHSANLQGANLQGADLSNTNLQSADLRSANLQGADLHSANLQRANLQGADLHSANLQRANLEDADFRQFHEFDDKTYPTQITPEQVKLAKNWEKAEYEPEFRKKLKSKNETGEFTLSEPFVLPESVGEGGFGR